MITHIPLVAGNLPIKTMVARRWPTILLNYEYIVASSLMIIPTHTKHNLSISKLCVKYNNIMVHVCTTSLVCHGKRKYYTTLSSGDDVTCSHSIMPCTILVHQHKSEDTHMQYAYSYLSTLILVHFDTVGIFRPNREYSTVFNV
jgi:hypothetical protein